MEISLLFINSVTINI